MARTAMVRSASLAPEEARLAEELARVLARGSFTELTRLLLRQFGEPLKRQIDALEESGIDQERLLRRALHTVLQRPSRSGSMVAWLSPPRDPHWDGAE